MGFKMNRFDKVTLKDGRVATLMGEEKMLGRRTGNALVFISKKTGSFVVKTDSLSLVSDSSSPVIYPDSNIY